MRRCVDCENEETITIKDGMYYYTCPTCAEIANNKPHKEGDIKCPECGCYAYERIIVSGIFSNEGRKEGAKLIDLYPVRPVEKFRCKGCGIRWDNPKFVEYLLKRNIIEGKF